MHIAQAMPCGGWVWLSPRGCRTYHVFKAGLCCMFFVLWHGRLMPPMCSDPACVVCSSCSQICQGLSQQILRSGSMLCVPSPLHTPSHQTTPHTPTHHGPSHAATRPTASRTSKQPATPGPKREPRNRTRYACNLDCPIKLEWRSLWSARPRWCACERCGSEGSGWWHVGGARWPHGTQIPHQQPCHRNPRKRTRATRVR